MKRGLEQYISSVNPDTDFEFCTEINEIYRYKDIKSLIIIVDNKLIPKPCIFSLDKIKSILPDSKLIGIADEKLPDNQVPYFEKIIYTTQAEEEIAAGFYQIYGKAESKKNSPNSHLSERETEILKFVALGFTNKEIGGKLFISAHTVITHRKNITAKLGIKTIAGLTVYAVLNGIVRSAEINQ